MLQKIKQVLKMEGASPLVRRIIIGVVGGPVILIGIALIVLPGPAFTSSRLDSPFSTTLFHVGQTAG